MALQNGNAPPLPWPAGVFNNRLILLPILLLGCNTFRTLPWHHTAGGTTPLFRHTPP
jgi:hypothetical protein